MLAIEPPEQFKDTIDRDRKRKRHQSIQNRSIVEFSTQFVDKLIREVVQLSINKTPSRTFQFERNY